jgi:hypothetical protein
MTRVTIQCPRCDTTTAVPLDALLVALVDEDRDLELAADVGWLCQPCAALIHVPIDWAALLTLVTEGASLLTDEEPGDALSHPETPAHGPAFTSDDVLELHELLESDSWFELLAAGGARP